MDVLEVYHKQEECSVLGGLKYNYSGYTSCVSLCMSGLNLMSKNLKKKLYSPLKYNYNYIILFL